MAPHTSFLFRIHISKILVSKPHWGFGVPLCSPTRHFDGVSTRTCDYNFTQVTWIELCVANFVF